MDEKFEQMKQDVLNNFSEEKLFRTSILNTPELWETDLYKFCENMPKGADLHAHGGAMIPVWSLIDFTKTRDDILVDTTPEHKGFLLLKSKNPPSTYMTLQDALSEELLSEAELQKIWTLIGRPNGVAVWEYFQTLFEMHNDLNEVGPTCKDYFKYAFEYYCKHNIFHVEIRLFLKGSERYAFQKTHCVFDAYREVKKQHPELVVKVITVGLKSKVFDMEVTEEIFKNTVKMHRQIKDGDDDFIVGIDLVNEEDTSRNITVFSHLINQTLNEATNLNVNLHAGESCDPKNREIAHAIALGSKRIGHGLNLWAHPELKSALKSEDICLEVCPISNQSLGFVKDLRDHPAREYFREGIPIVLASDDATYQEHSTLSDDFFMAILAWDLSYEEVQKLVENSLKYSY